MVFEELKKDLMEAEADMRSYFVNSEEYLELKVFKVLMQFLAASLKTVFVSLGVLFALFFFIAWFGARLVRSLRQLLPRFYYGRGFLCIDGYRTLYI